MRELDDKNGNDREVKSKICSFCDAPLHVDLTRTASTDMGLIPLTKAALLAAVKEHVSTGRRLFTDRMDNMDTAYIVSECLVDGDAVYVKVKFFQLNGEERMLVISSHPPRRW